MEQVFPGRVLVSVRLANLYDHLDLRKGRLDESGVRRSRSPMPG